MKARRSISSMAKLVAAVSAGAVSLLLAGCFYMPGVSGGSARAGLVLPRDVVANPVSLALIVGGPGMNPLFSSYTTIPSSISIDVPSGLARTFTVLLNSPSATLQGMATVDLQPGETKDITVTPTLAGTQIIAPDWFKGRLVQISDMSGTGRINLATTSPYDVDFDDQGRIYIASGGSVVRINDIKDSSFVTIDSPSQSSILAVAMDRPRGLLYYTDGTSIWRMQVMTTPLGPEEAVQVGSIFVGIQQTIRMNFVRGIAVDSDGFLYIADDSSSFPASTILKINPNPASNPTLVRESAYSFTRPWDVTVKGDFVYVSDGFLDVQGAPKGGQIVRLDKNLAFVDSLSGFGADSFLGPERFVAILNKPITVVDEPSTGAGDRLVSFNDMTGAGWTTYAGGADPFMFFAS